MDNNMNNNFSYTTNSTENNNPNNTYTNSDVSASSKNNKSLPIIIIFVIIAMGIGLFFFLGNKNDDIKDGAVASSFFLQNSERKTALFTKDGKKVTDFIYSSNYTFVNGYSLVEKDNKTGIIKENGQMSVDFGKYKSIFRYAGLYKVTDMKYNHLLIDGSGKVITDLKDKEIITFLGINKFIIIKDENAKSISIINNKGKEVKKIQGSSISEKDPSVSIKDGYYSLFYSNKNYLFSLETDKEIISFEDTIQHCVSGVSKDGKSIVLRSCSNWSSKTEENSVKIFNNNKLTDLTNKCDSAYYESGVLICNKGSHKYLLDKNLNLGIDYYKTNAKDSDNYVTSTDGAFEGVDFYKDGKLAKHVACRSLNNNNSISEVGIYVLRTYYSRECNTTSGSYDFYKTNGEKLSDKTYVFANSFDKNGLAKVSEDRISYYMINTKGQKIGQEYENIVSDYSESYVVTKNKLKGLMSKEGKEIIKPEYLEISTFNNDVTGKTYARMTTIDSKYILYNLTDNKEIVKADEKISDTSGYYFTIKKGTTIQYYTYNGKMIYEDKVK